MDDITEDYNREADLPKHQRATQDAQKVIAFYSELVGRNEPPDTLLADLLADLMHWAEAQTEQAEDEEEEIDFTHCLYKAEADYEAERPVSLRK